MTPHRSSTASSQASAVAAAQQRIARLASQPAIHRALHWLHLHQRQIRQWQLEIVRIPAPPFHESARAAWFLDRFHDLGLTNVHLDEAGNALAELHPPTPPSTSLSSFAEGGGSDFSSPQPTQPSNDSPHPFQSAQSAVGPSPHILLSAHLDTVFPPNTPCDPTESPSSPRIHAPGICDNAAGLSALLAIAAALQHARIAPPTPILFAANVGEEGEGDLRGMKHLFRSGAYRGRIAAALVLDGSGSSAAVTRALGSLRLRLTITGPGGHSWTDAGAPNPILLLSEALTRLASLPLPSHPRTTLNVGHISGGTSINSIPQSASALLDLRSTDPGQLAQTEIALRRAFDDFMSSALSLNSISNQVKHHVTNVGDRPAATLPDASPLLHTLRAIDRHLGLRTDPRTASTDANIPLSLNIPALALGTGGVSGGIHTLQEWYDPTGRETALRRILLTLLATGEFTQLIESTR